MRTAAIYAVLIAAATLGFLVLRSLGADLVAPAPSEGVGFGAGGKATHADDLLHVLFALVVIIFAARLVGALFGLIRQPPVMGEVVAGILLGPSALGRLSPQAAAFLLPQSISPFLGVIAQVGVI